MPLADGQVIAGYTILRSLGAGGMGEVYLAQHPRLPRRDALKVLSETVCAESEYCERFKREADIAATLWHPHIVEVHDRGEVDGQLWISMDYVEGTDAGRLLAERYPNGMPADEVVRIVTAVAEALDYAHQRGLLHRDVKPANILIANPDTDDERIMLADFGIARRVGETSTLTGTNMTVGTVAYAAPEQLKGEDDRRTRRPVRACGNGLPAADRHAAVPTLQPGGRHQPAPHRRSTAYRHPPARIVRSRTGFRQGARQVTERPLRPMH